MDNLKGVSTLTIKEQTFEELYVRNNNAFDILRFLLATMVIYAHSYPLLIGSGKSELIYRITNGQLSAGSLAVYSFFIISGFLITQSITFSKSYF